MPRKTALGAILAITLLPGCISGMAMTVPTDPRPDAAAPEAAEAKSVIEITATLADDPDDGLPPKSLDTLSDAAPVKLDLTVLPPLMPAVQVGDGTWADIGPCSFGPLDAAAVSVPTGSHHMLLEVRLGTPESHAANLLSCEYRPDAIDDETLGGAIRVRGCFLAQPVSIPTAVHWVLNPLPAEACGIGD